MNFFRMWKMVASIAQGQALRSIGNAATSVLPLSMRLVYSPFRKCSYKCRSGRASVRSRRSTCRWSSSSSRRLAISLCPLRGHWILNKTAPSVCLVKMKMPRWSPSEKLIRPGKKFIFQISAQTAFKSLRLLRRRLDLKKQSSLQTDASLPTLRAGTQIFKTAGGARAAVRKKLQKI